MSVVVTWTSGGGPSRVARLSAPPVQQAAQVVLRRHAAARLAPEPAHRVARLDGGTHEPLRIGPSVGVGSGAGQRGRSEPARHRGAAGVPGRPFG